MMENTEKEVRVKRKRKIQLPPPSPAFDRMTQKQREGLKRLGQAMERVKIRAGREKDAAAEEAVEILWENIGLFENFPFYTSQKLEFTYTVKGNEMFIDRKGKSITKSTVRLAFKKSMELQEEGVFISGPKKIGCFGASYLYPVFIHMGVVELTGLRQ